MARQGFDLQLTRYDERGWRATFYTTGMEHAPTSATGTGWERTTGERVWEAELLRLEGELRLAASPHDVAEALDCFRRAIEIARRQAARSWELRAALSLARLHVAEGRRDEARRTVGGVYETQMSSSGTYRQTFSRPEAHASPVLHRCNGWIGRSSGAGYSRKVVVEGIRFHRWPFQRRAALPQTTK
jgi:hypothetical protein